MTVHKANARQLMLYQPLALMITAWCTPTMLIIQDQMYWDLTLKCLCDVSCFAGFVCFCLFVSLYLCSSDNSTCLLDSLILAWWFTFFLEIISFEDEPGKQVRSAVRIKNTSKSNVAFKVMKFRFLLMFMFFVVFTCNGL